MRYRYLWAAASSVAIALAYWIIANSDSVPLETPRDGGIDPAYAQEIDGLRREIEQLRLEIQRVKTSRESSSPVVSRETLSASKALGEVDTLQIPAGPRSLIQESNSAEARYEFVERFLSEEYGSSNDQPEYLALLNAASSSDSTFLESIECKKSLCRLVIERTGQFDEDQDEMLSGISQELARNVTIYHQKLSGGREALYLEID